MELNRIDTAILASILANSRQPFTKLAKKMHISRERIAYRYNRLVNAGIIRATNAKINAELLGFKRYTLYLKYSNSDSRENSIIKNIMADFSVSWIGKLAGEWTLAIIIYAQDEHDLRRQTEGIFGLFGQNLVDYKLFSNMQHMHHLNKINAKVKNKNKKHKLDRLDLKLLEELNANARATYAELSGKFKLTANGIMARIKKLEKSGILAGYGVVVNPAQMHLELFGVRIRFLNFEPATKTKFEAFLKEHPTVLFFNEYISGEIDIGLAVKNNGQLRDFLAELRSRFSNNVTTESFFLLTEQITDGRLPKKIFQEMHE